MFVICDCSDRAEVLQPVRPGTELHSLVCRVHRLIHFFPHPGGPSDIWRCTGTEHYLWDHELH